MSGFTQNYEERVPGAYVKKRQCVLDKTLSTDPAARLGLSHGNGRGDNFQARITDRDRRPPRSVVTAQLMGDPKPGRSAADGFKFPEQPAAPSPMLWLLPEWPDEDVDRLWELKGQGKTQTEIAAIMGRPLGAVASKIRRTR